MLRIISGKHKGNYISAPKSIRPTKDNVKEALFNVIGSCVADARVLDLFAGSGSLGIEALSRGAGYVFFADNSRTCIETIKENLSKVMPKDADKKTSVFNKEAMATIKILHGKNKKFDIILLDPPYYKGWIKKCLKYLNIYDILAPSGVILAEHFKKDEMPQQLAGLKLIRQLTYGDTIISIFKRT